MNIWIRALRVNQWTKNAVVFAAWFFAVADASQSAVARGVRPFLLVCAMALSFSLVASAFYLLNDVADYEADRLLPSPRTSSPRSPPSARRSRSSPSASPSPATLSCATPTAPGALPCCSSTP